MSKPFTPRPYQGHIIGHILDVDRCAVWAGMGMGKTSSTLSATAQTTFSQTVGSPTDLAITKVVTPAQVTAGLSGGNVITAQAVVDDVKAALLLGRGGAGFPAGVK